MRHGAPRPALPATLLLAMLAALAAPALAAAPTLGPAGLGPLKLGMTRTAAVATGWLAGRGRGCPLGGTPPITYRLTGPKAPTGLKGSVEFSGGRLRTVVLTGGARTSLGTRIGDTPASMVRRYRAAGFRASARYDSTFQGTFVHVRRGRRLVLGAFATGGRLRQIAAPAVPVCE